MACLQLVERKKELDSTKEKMDHLVEKLYIGREKGLELRGAIDFHLERYRAVRLQDAAAARQFAAGGNLLPGAEPKPAPEPKALPPIDAKDKRGGARGGAQAAPPSGRRAADPKPAAEPKATPKASKAPPPPELEPSAKSTATAPKASAGKSAAPSPAPAQAPVAAAATGDGKAKSKK